MCEYENNSEMKRQESLQEGGADGAAAAGHREGSAEARATEAGDARKQVRTNWLGMVGFAKVQFAFAPWLSICALCALMMFMRTKRYLRKAPRTG